MAPRPSQLDQSEARDFATLVAEHLTEVLSERILRKLEDVIKGEAASEDSGSRAPSFANIERLPAIEDGMKNIDKKVSVSLAASKTPEHLSPRLSSRRALGPIWLTSSPKLFKSSQFCSEDAAQAQRDEACKMSESSSNTPSSANVSGRQKNKSARFHNVASHHTRKLLEANDVRMAWRTNVIADNAVAPSEVMEDKLISSCSSNGFNRSHSGTSHHLQFADLRKSRTSELASSVSSQSTDDEGEFKQNALKASVYPILRLFGILPWDLGHSPHTSFWKRPSLGYQHGVFLLTLLSALLKVAFGIGTILEHNGHPSVIGLSSDKEFLLSDLSLAFGSVICLLCLGIVKGSPTLCTCNITALAYMRREGFLEEWKYIQRVEASRTIAFVIAITATHFGAHISSETRDFSSALSACSAALSATMVSGVVYCIFYISNGINGMLNLFAENVMTERRLKDAVHEWNVLQAVMRTASCCVERCFAGLLMIAATFVVLAAVDVLRGAHIISMFPGLLTILNILRVILRAASVTEKCERLPPLVNSIACTDVMDAERQYLVEYMINSRAGFHIFEARITQELAFKYTYLWCVVIAFVSTRFLQDGTSS